MKTRYKIPLIVGILFVIIWPQIPHIIWIGCEILPYCNAETSYASGIGLPWISINTNFFDNLPENMSGFLILGISFSLMTFLVVWRIKLKKIFKIIIPCIVFLILVFVSLWIEYGVVCNDHVIDHLRKYSNLFDENTTRETFGMLERGDPSGMLERGYPFVVHGGNIQECVDYVFESRT
ncbi:MAG: hypothetical protein ACW9W4_07880 [Candidatus Nitrosopumilus sp. bin_7KS]